VLIPVRKLSRIWNVHPSGVLHIGAHHAEESVDYRKAGWEPVMWIEAQEDLATELKQTLDPTSNQVVCAVVSDISGEEIEFYVSSNGQSSSILKFGTHSTNYPETEIVATSVLKTSTIDSIVSAETMDFDFMNLDIQGAELKALKGSKVTLSKVKWVYTEVNYEEVYQGGALVYDLDAYLANFGFKRKATRWCFGLGWGDALYVKMDATFSFRQRVLQFFDSLVWNLNQIIRLPIRKIRRKI
jgi:FkbM family methyltransferase